MNLSEIHNNRVSDLNKILHPEVKFATQGAKGGLTLIVAMGEAAGTDGYLRMQMHCIIDYGNGLADKRHLRLRAARVTSTLLHL